MLLTLLACKLQRTTTQPLVTPEMNPETGQIVHLHKVELYQASPDEAV